MTKKIEVFASEAQQGELENFPNIKRGWGVTKESTGGIPPMKWFNAIQKRTDEAINAIAEGSISGYTFKDGATLDSHNDFIYDDVSKSWYFWIGESGKAIPPNSNASEIIETDGGIWSNTNPDGLWVSVGDASLRGRLKNGDGSLIGLEHGTLRDNLYYVTPEQFTSSMNGSDDWAIAINAALDYVWSIGGGIVQLKAKDYIVKSQILMPDNCTLRGCGILASRVKAHELMDPELNVITSKNNPMYKVVSDGTSGNEYTYIEGVFIQDMMVDGGAKGRYEQGITNGKPISRIQSCGIKLVSAKKSGIQRVFVRDCLMHCFDIAASNYFDDGDANHNIDGGSDGVEISKCFGDGSMYDDIFTTHNSKNITIANSVAINSGHNPYMKWGNNQHGFEIDEGSENVDVIDCRAEGVMCGFQAKGHDTTLPARNIKFVRCHAKDNRWSFMITHTARSLSTIVGNNILLRDCTSENPHHDPSKTYDESLPTDNPFYRPRHVWLFGYDNVKIRDITITGGEGLIEIGYPDTMTATADVKGVYWSGGYNGIYKGNDTYGLINILSGRTTGKHKLKNIKIKDQVYNPVIRCVDTQLTKGIVIDGVEAVGSNNCPCILTTLNIPSNISNIDSDGFLYALVDSSVPGSVAKNYRNDLIFQVVDGIAHIVVESVLNGDIHPARVGNIAISKGTGVQYRAKFNNNGVVGQWVQSSI